ncbi:PREDICTED: uncharacterized protein LOC108370869 [Rhagoletis zephyria]|uniref:uncharacterized protein LOC108370869 n=1 Tax=Rhagoletis zephyria TaxID=28612 RepID=UPI000811635F|nr:PREDICTED: uncharacterized protein LOC108370869 [Rhagoletis zephyria]
MAILQSCCFWKTVRKGSMASATYTLVYFGFSTIVMLITVYDEQEYLAGTRRRPIGESFLARGEITPAIVIFNILFLICSACLVICSLLVFAGMKRHRSAFLLPWIVFMLCDVLIELFHLVYLSITQMVNFDPVVGFIFTIDFFIMCLNTYCLLCVISQYQNYLQGRGYADQQMRTEIVIETVDGEVTERQSCLKTTKINKSLASPYITTNPNTHISTIPEEMDQNYKIRTSSGTPSEPADDKSLHITVNIPP